VGSDATPPQTGERGIVMSVAIRLAACAKTFADGTRALEPLDLAIAAGETVVILGPSGCGKTTALRIIAGLEEPDASGRAFFDNADVTAIPIERRNVGMVFQSYALFPNMTVAENVAYGLKVRRTAKAEREARAAEMLAMMGIEALADRRIDQLSGGQRQRVALARAIAPRPNVLLLDEPLTALDAKLRDRLRIEIDRLLRSLGITAIYVTHDQAEAMALGDRIVVMSKGRVAQVGAPRDIYYRPADRFVAEFVGAMNRLSGEASGGRLTVPGGALPWSGADGRHEILFRPEDLSLSDACAAHVSGEVQSALFLGDRLRLIVTLGADASVLVETTDHANLQPGARVHLRLAPERLLTL
jgi:putative spermidine/putrescine transport system ATP-binding protein